MDKSIWREKCMQLEKHTFFRVLFSHYYLSFFYGIFLFLYEISFLREWVSQIHPVLIIWAGMVIIYDIFIRKIWIQIPYWQPLFLFIISAGITAILTFQAGIVGNIKAWILTILPLLIFYPVCFLKSKYDYLKSILLVISGAAFVSCVASGVAIYMFLNHISQTVSVMGVVKTIGIRNYLPNDPTSAILLYGIYVDTNHAAIYALSFIFYSILLLTYIKKEKKGWKIKIIKIFAILNLCIQSCYFPLANSRGGWVSLCVAIFIVSFLYFFSKCLIKRRILRCIISIGKSFLIVLLCCVSFLMIRTGMSAISLKIESYKINQNTNLVNEMNQSKNTEDSAEVEEPQIQDIIVNNTEKSLEIENGSINNSGLSEDDVKVSEESKNLFTKKNEHVGAGRIEIWRDTLKLIKHRPIMGECPGNKGYYAPIYSPKGIIAQRGVDVHNSYLDLILDYGVVGAFLLLFFWCLCGLTILKKILKKGNDIDRCFYIGISMVLTLVCGVFFLSSAFINITAIYFLMLLIISYVMTECVYMKSGTTEK